MSAPEYSLENTLNFKSNPKPKSNRPFVAAIFDMDGLLLDTERLCMGVFEKACKSLNLPFDSALYLQIIGRNSQGVHDILAPFYKDDYSAVSTLWRENYNRVVLNQAISVKAGVVALLSYLREQGIKLAVATSTQRIVAERKLHLAGLSEFFEHISCGCEVSQGKPHPEIYQLAAARLQVNEAQCLAFEDSNNGVRAALSAGMMCYQIPDLVPCLPELQAQGAKVRASLVEVLNELQNAERIDIASSSVASFL